jgi:hypothetical protein
MKQKLLQQGYVAPRLMPSLQNFYCRDDELADRYEISISQKAMFFFYLYVYFFFTLSQTKTNFSQLTI